MNCIADARQEEEAESVIFQGADVRAGEAVPAAKVPLGAGEGAPLPDPQPHAQPGQDLVPEPPLQDQEGLLREGHGGALLLAGSGRCGPATGGGLLGVHPVGHFSASLHFPISIQERAFSHLLSLRSTLLD